MAVNDFTGKNIQDTYQKVVQTDGTNLADGTGSLLPISFDGNNVIISGSLIATEYSVTSSVTNIQIATLSGSTEFGNTADDTHQFIGNITASGDISSSSDIYGSTLYSEQGIMHDNDANTGITFSSDTLQFITNTVQTAKFAGGTTQLGNTSYTTGITGSTISFKGNITSSGNISSSGGTSVLNALSVMNAFEASNIRSDTDITYTADFDGNEVGQHIFKDRTTILATIDETGADFISHITASGNISSSGEITAESFRLKDNRQFYFSTDNNERIYGDGTSIYLLTGGSTRVKFDDGGAWFTGHITSSGNISGSSTTVFSGLEYKALNNFEGQSFYFTDGATGIELAANTIDIVGAGGDILTHFSTTALELGSGDHSNIPTKIYGHVTASGNISASGDIYGDDLVANGIYANDYFIAGKNAIDYVSNTDTILYGQTNAQFKVRGETILLGGATNQHVTASGNISSSGDLYGFNLFINRDADIGRSVIASQNIRAGGNISSSGYISTETYITASGGISSSGTVIANEANIIGHITASGIVSASGGFFGDITTIRNATNAEFHPVFVDSANAELTRETLYTSNNTLTYNPSTNAMTLGQITASGNISSSGAIIGKTLTVGSDVFTVDTSGNITTLNNLTAGNNSTSDIHTLKGKTTFTGDITSSGNISSSGVITGASIASDATFIVTQGGTGATSFANKSVIITQDSGTDTLAAVAMSTNGQLLIGGSSGPAAATLTAGNGILVTNVDGGITIANNLAAGNGLTLELGEFLLDLDASLTTVTSVLNTGLVIGRDATDQIKFGTDNQIIFRVDGADGVTFKASGEIEATKFDGALEGNADTATTATNATHVTVTDNESTNEENLIPFIEDASATGNVGLESDGDFAYNPSTGTVSATIFKGTTSLQTPLIEFTDGDDAIVIADGGGVTIADLTATTADINGGTIDGATIATSDVTVGSGKTLDVSAGTLTLAANQISGDKVEGGTIAATTITRLTTAEINASADLDIGAHNFKSATLQADELPAGRVVVTGTDGVLASDSDLTFATDTLTATKIGAFEAAGAINFNSQNMTNVDIDSGTIDGATIATSDITVGAEKTLDVSAGTLTLAANQISGDKVEGGTIAATTITTLTTAAINASTDIDIGSHDLKAQTLTSDVATGTAPLTIDSTTAVTNLTAQFATTPNTNKGESHYGDYIKLIPSDFATNSDGLNTKHGVGYVNAAGTGYGIKVPSGDTELFAFVSIPEGMKATHVEIFGKRTRGVEVFEVQINATTMTSKGTGNCNTEFAINNSGESAGIAATATNLLAIEVDTISTSADRVYGGRVKIATI